MSDARDDEEIARAILQIVKTDVRRLKSSYHAAADSHGSLDRDGIMEWLPTFGLPMDITPAAAGEFYDLLIEEADANNLRRHLKEQLEIVTAEDKEKKEVAKKAEEIAKKMQEMAAKADGAWKEVRAAKRKTAEGFAEAKTDYAQRKEAAKEAQTKRRQAEDKAQLASTRLAAADKDVRVLLQVRRIWICRCLCRCATAPGPPLELSRLSPCALRLLTEFAAGASVCIRSTKSWRRCGWQRTQNRRLALQTHSGRTLSARTPSRRPCFVPRPLNGGSSSL